MNSSISSSEGPVWRRFSATFVAASASILVVILAFAYALDPYDTGRSSLFAAPGVRPQGPRTAAASRGRDPAFDAAIFGNSRIQLLSPERLDRKTGLDFVQLSVPATGPKEQLTLAEWFLRSRREPARAVVIGADTTWCTGDPDLANEKPFPFWLYSSNPLAYLRGLLRYDLLEEIPRRLEYVFSAKLERARPDGFWNYEADYLALGFKSDPALLERLEQPVAHGTPLNDTGRFPAAERLRDLASTLPGDLALILVFPPAYKAALSPDRTPRGASDLACKQALAAAAAIHPRSAVIDWRADRPENANPEHYFDQVHYREPVARKIEDEIAHAVKHLSGRR